MLDALHRKEGVESMCSRQLSKIIAVLISGLFFIQLIAVKPVSAAVPQAAYYNDISNRIEVMAAKYNIPPVLLKSVAWMESGWKQYHFDAAGQPLLDQPLIGSDGIGIGIMQISTYDPKDQVTMDKLKNDIDYNIEMGCQALNQKWRAYPKIGNGDRNVLENWYFAVWGYNCWGARNNPNNLTGKSAYQDSVFSLMGQKYNSAITFAPGATKLPKSLLPLLDPPSLSSLWSTPTPTHQGDLLIDSNSLISSGGGSGTDAANGDYWDNFYINSKSRGNYYIHALGFYDTVYNSASITDKSIVTQKILSTYSKLLAEADTLILDKTDSSYVSAAKDYWAVLQGANLDAGITERATTGLQQTTKPIPDTNTNTDPDSTPKVSALIRIAGSDRVDTAIKQSLAGWPQGASTVVLARSDDFPDALAGVPLAAQLDAPVLLTPSQGLDSRVQAALKVLHPGKVYLLGGEGALSAKVSADLKTLGWDSGNQIRLSGANRYATAANISQAITGVQHSAVAIATGENFPDALSIASIAGQKKMPVLLTSKTEIPQETLDALKKLNPSKVYLVGGEGVISPSVAKGIYTGLKMSSSNVIRLAGASRYETMTAVGKAFEGEIKGLSFATGEDFPNALTGAALAAHQNQTLVLLPATSLEGHPALKELITCHLSQSATQPYLSGNLEAIPQGMEDQLKAILLD